MSIFASISVASASTADAGKVRLGAFAPTLAPVKK